MNRNSIAAICIAAFLIGVLFGYVRGHDKAVAEQAKEQTRQAVASLKIAERQYQATLESETKLQEKINQTQKQLEKARAELSRFPTVVPISVGGLSCPDNPNLSVGTVSVLSASSQGTNADAAPISDGQGKAASDVPVSELARYTVEVMFLYNDLAARHDSLVDWLTKTIKDRAK